MSENNNNEIYISEKQNIISILPQLEKKKYINYQVVSNIYNIYSFVDILNSDNDFVHYSICVDYGVNMIKIQYMDMTDLLSQIKTATNIYDIQALDKFLGRYCYLCEDIVKSVIEECDNETLSKILLMENIDLFWLPNYLMCCPEYINYISYKNMEKILHNKSIDINQRNSKRNSKHYGLLYYFLYHNYWSFSYIVLIHPNFKGLNYKELSMLESKFNESYYERMWNFHNQDINFSRFKYVYEENIKKIVL